MCGICGFIASETSGRDEQAIDAMSAVLQHRGPEGEGRIALEDGARRPAGWFGHRRLKIIDLTEAAHQPMASDDRRVVLSYNGEVYNFRELRRTLEGLGHRFRSTGDAEVVLRAYEQWGEHCVQRLDGMFAFAIWDAGTGTLHLARDRTGKKPLFYARAGPRILFGSEIKSILASGWIRPEPDASQVAEFLTYGYVPHPSTLLRGVEQVPPASVVSVSRGGTPRTRRYWSVPVPGSDGPPRRVDGDLLAELRRRFETAVARRMVADVPVGAFLSGGIDSSLVVAAMSKVADGPVHTFSVGFPDESSFDERSYARAIAKRFGAHHTEFAVRMDAVSLLDRLIWHHDQPFGDSSAIPTYIVSELAAEQVTVVLNGDGGDEVFGGYDRFVDVALAERVPRALAGPLRRATAVLPDTDGYHSLRRRAHRLLEAAGDPIEDRYQSWVAVVPRHQVAELVRPELLPASLDLVNRSMEAVYDRVPDHPALDRVLLTNFETYLPGDLSVKMDRMSMAHSLEARAPFLDTAVIELMGRVPAARKVGLRRPKPVLRRAFRDLLPAAIWNRRKHGFEVPMQAWFRGELGEVFEDQVLAPDAASAEYLERDAVRRLYDSHRSGASEATRLWTILTLERWLRHLRSSPLATAPGPQPVLG